MTLITSFGVLALAGIVNGHGYLTIPKSRVALGFEVMLHPTTLDIYLIH